MEIQPRVKKKIISEINVTPLVDVMLVLLVIFMITAPLLYNSIQLNLPRTKEVEKTILNTEQIILSFTSEGNLFLGERPVSKEGLLPLILTEFSKTKNKILFLRADYEIRYGEVAKLMSFLKNGGISHIALVTEIEKTKK